MLPSEQRLNATASSGYSAKQILLQDTDKHSHLQAYANCQIIPEEYETTASWLRGAWQAILIHVSKERNTCRLDLPSTHEDEELITT